MTSLPEPRLEDTRLVRGLLRLYPAGWRERYGGEFAEVLATALARGGRRWRIAADVAAGALDARLERSFNLRRDPMTDRIRGSASIAFCAFVAFVIAGSGFAKMTEDPAFKVAARAHPAVGWSFEVIYAGAILAGLAVLAGALPVLVAIGRQILAGRRDLLRLLAVAPLAVGAWVGGVLILVAGAPAAAPPGTRHGEFIAVLGAGVLAAAVSAGALVRAAHRADLPARVARAQPFAMTVLSAAMVAVSAAGLVWGLALRSQAPVLYHSDSGLVASALPATWAATVGVMAVASALALAVTVRAVALARGDPGATAAR